VLHNAERILVEHLRPAYEKLADDTDTAVRGFVSPTVIAR
jgi:hypothetical protein